MSKNTARLVAGRDTWVNQNKPAQNYKGGTRIQVRAQNGGKNGRYGLLSFNVKIPKNAKVIKATLRMTMREATSGTRTMTVRRITTRWKQAKVNWNSVPDVDGGAVTLTKGGRPAFDQWEFDVTAHMQAVANGATWLGWRIESNETTIRKFNSSEARYWKPVLEIEWDESPRQPNDLNPGGGGFVATGSPVLSWDFRDNRGSTGMGGFQVQLSTTPTFGTILHDSGVVNTSNPSYNLATASGWTALTNDTPVYWRVKVKDTGNNWSGWSDVTSFGYDVKGTLTIIGPSGSTIRDPSPTVAWSLTGRTQSQWQVLVRNARGEDLYDSGRYASLAQSWTIPAKVGKTSIIGRRNTPYTIVVRVWDNVNRSSAVGDDILYEVTRTVTYVPGTGTAPSTPTVTDLSNTGMPGLELVWSHTEAPDRFDIWREDLIDGSYTDARLIEALEPGELVTGVAGKYMYNDFTVRAGETYRYKVGASVNGVAVESGSAVATRRAKSVGIWLVDQFRDIRVQILGDDAGSWEMGEESTTYTPLGATSPRLVTQALRGYEGSISGQLVDTGSKPVYEQERDLLDLKETQGMTYMLVLPDMAFPVVVSNVNIAPTPYKETVRDVSFNFFQQAD